MPGIKIAVMTGKANENGISATCLAGGAELFIEETGFHRRASRSFSTC